MEGSVLRVRLLSVRASELSAQAQSLLPKAQESQDARSLKVIGHFLSHTSSNALHNDTCHLLNTY